MIHSRSRSAPASLLLLLLPLAACSAGAPDQISAASPRGSAALARPRDVPGAVRALTRRDPADREVTVGRDGSRLVRLRDGHAEVMVARSNPDGSVSTRCVDSGDAAEAFLNEASAAPAARAAQ